MPSVMLCSFSCAFACSSCSFDRVAICSESNSVTICAPSERPMRSSALRCSGAVGISTWMNPYFVNSRPISVGPNVSAASASTVIGEAELCMQALASQLACTLNTKSCRSGSWQPSSTPTSVRPHIAAATAVQAA